MKITGKRSACRKSPYRIRCLWAFALCAVLAGAIALVGCGGAEGGGANQDTAQGASQAQGEDQGEESAQAVVKGNGMWVPSKTVRQESSTYLDEDGNMHSQKVDSEAIYTIGEHGETLKSVKTTTQTEGLLISRTVEEDTMEFGEDGYFSTQRHATYAVDDENNKEELLATPLWEFDDQGRATKCTVMENGEEGETSEYDYASEGYISMRTVSYVQKGSVKSGHTYELSTITLTTYDSDGFPTAQHMDLIFGPDEDDRYFSDTTYEYERDADGKPTSAKEELVASFADGVFSTATETYTYDENDNIVTTERKVQNADGTDAQVTANIEYTYVAEPSLWVRLYKSLFVKS